MNDPASFIPVEPQDFIGEARQLALMFENKAAALKALVESGKKAAPVKLLLYGVPGCGKTRLVELFANRLAFHPVAIESINGRNVNIDVVRRWQKSSRYVPMGKFSIRICNEVDTITPQVQDLLLTVLDEAAPNSVFLATSNLEILMLSERFETRMQQFKLEPPTTEEIAGFLIRKWGFPKQRALEVAVGSAGNVRAACLDAQSLLDVRRAA